MLDLLTLASQTSDRFRAHCSPACRCLENIAVGILEENGIEPTPGLVRNLTHNAIERFGAHERTERK